MYKNIVFDLDGTLIDSAPSILKCLDLSLNQHDISPIIPLTYKVIGPPLEVTLKKLTGITDPSIIKSLINCFRDVYDAEGYKVSVPYEGVDQMLLQLGSSGASIHLATNKRITPTIKILEHFSWHSLFETVYAIYVGDVSFKSKTHMLAALLRDKALDPANTIYVGDINADYQAADKNGMQFIFAEWGYEKKGEYQYPLSATDIQDLTSKAIA